ncbi:MAG: DJ-1 family glyoxalase III [Neisseriaceae bacterium]
MVTVLVFLTTGFEEIEALTPTDILRRAGLKVQLVSLETKKEVLGGHGVLVTADLLFEESKSIEADAYLLPGGTVRIAEHPKLKEKLTEVAGQGKLLAAICAAPMVFGQLGLLKGKKATCYPGFENYLEGAQLQDDPTVVDGQFVTANGPGAAIQFALVLVEKLAGTEKKQEVIKQLHLQCDRIRI